MTRIFMDFNYLWYSNWTISFEPYMILMRVRNQSVNINNTAWAREKYLSSVLSSEKSLVGAKFWYSAMEIATMLCIGCTTLRPYPNVVRLLGCYKTRRSFISSHLHYLNNIVAIVDLRKIWYLQETFTA